MGRSRAAQHSANEDPNQRAKRKKTAFGIDSLETSFTGIAAIIFDKVHPVPLLTRQMFAQKGVKDFFTNLCFYPYLVLFLYFPFPFFWPDLLDHPFYLAIFLFANSISFLKIGRVNEGNGALYHCNYCNKDITGKIRFKCVICPDFDLCVECFSVGAEVTPHKSNHAYSVVDNLSFPLLSPDWNADEEILLLEGIEMYGMGNWNEVAGHVGTKIKSQCIEHYNSIFMNSPCFPLPDMSHVLGKNREELIEMFQEHCQLSKGLPTLGEHTLKVESPPPVVVKTEEVSACPSSSSLTVDAGTGMGFSSGNMSTGTIKKAPRIMTQVIDVHEGEDIKAEGRSMGENKPRASGDEGPSVTELSGYNPKRQEFEVEYDNDAEQLLADMEFKDADTAAEQELKLRVLRIYSKRLLERRRRKDFILERDLLHPDVLEKNLPHEERELYKQYKVFMRFDSKEMHEHLVSMIIDEHQICKRIQDLREARAAGCHTLAEAGRYIEQKRKKEANEGEGASQSGKASHSRGEINGSPQGSFSKDSMEARISTWLDDWDITGLPGADLLSESERELCRRVRLLPSHYLKMSQTMSAEIMKGNLTNKLDAHSLFRVEASKVDEVYDLVIKNGIALP